MKPRFGFRTRGFAGQTVEQAAAELARIGFDCIEVCLESPDVRPETLEQKRCAELRRSFDAAGIAVASVSYHGDDEPLAERRANQERAVRIAHWFGANILVLNAERSVEQKRQWSEHANHYARLAWLADELDVSLAIEPEPLLVVGSSKDMIEMLREVAAPRFKVNFDVGHAQVTDDNPALAIRELGKNIIHVHLEDIKARVHRHLFFGEGDVKFPAVRQALLDIGYNGPYVADLAPQGDPSEFAGRVLAALQHRFA